MKAAWCTYCFAFDCWVLCYETLFLVNLILQSVQTDPSFASDLNRSKVGKERYIKIRRICGG